MGFAFKLGEKALYFDVFLCDYPGRKFPSICLPEEIVNADYFFGTHDHADHIDRESWYQFSISSPKAKFVVPNLLKEKLSKDLDIPLERFIGISDMGVYAEEGLKITGIAGSHEFFDQDPQTGEYPYMGYVVEYNGIKIYHSGDTCIYEGMYAKLHKFGKIDTAILPINGRDGKRLRANILGTMTWQEAVDLVGFLKPGLAVPAHYEMFDNNLADPLLFVDYLDIKFPGIKYWVGDYGTKVMIKKEQ